MRAEQPADMTASKTAPPPRKKRRTDRPATPPRRRAPPLERLPRWLFAPRRHFVAAHGELPLPRQVPVRGKPFYDWDAWALALLAPDLWRRRGPWQRLIACCTAAKPPHVDEGHVPDVKAALVRIVVAEVVSQLVSRADDQLTPEDRNWITSVASRQRGRHAKKPTLMLLFDLAFAVFDLAAFCRRAPSPATEVVLEDPADADPADEDDPIQQAIRDIITDECRQATKSQSETPAPPLPENASASSSQTDPSVKRGRSSRPAPSVDPVVRRVLQVVHKRPRDTSDNLIDNVNRAIDVIEKFLKRSKAQRWHHYFTSKADAAKDGLMQASRVFSQRMPLNSVKGTDDLKENDVFFNWLMHSLDGSNWAFWAELANDCNYIILTGSIPEERVREDACRFIVKSLLSGAGVSTSDATAESVMAAQMLYDETKLTVRRLFDMALCLEQFYSFFIETYGKSSAVGACIAWGVLCFEGLVQLLGRLRDVLILGSTREKAMIDWSARSLDIANYYREAVLVNQQMCEDIDRAIQNAFAEASWQPETRAARYMVPATPAEGSDSDSQAVARFWLSNLDLSDPIYLATAIVPWDPHRALQLLDGAIGLTSERLNSVYEGKEGLPLRDYRRVAICRVLLYRGLFPQTSLIIERLQLLFDQRTLQDGGNFSSDTIQLLESAMEERNFCAQTTYGLLLAGQGTYWDVARSWAKCEKSIAAGVQKLYLSAVAGDPEACTALSHIWAESGTEKENEEVFAGVTIDQVYALFRIAVASQNSKAVMNMGVLWRYGISMVKADYTIAIDAFLMALQGGIFGEARSVAAKHLSETIGQQQAGMSETLSKLTCASWVRGAGASSPYRIDDFGTAEQLP